MKKDWKEKVKGYIRDGGHGMIVNRKNGVFEDGTSPSEVKTLALGMGVKDDIVMESEVLQLENLNAKMVTGETVLSKAKNVGDQSSSASQSSLAHRTQ